jgi:hypothetical protein
LTISGEINNRATPPWSTYIFSNLCVLFLLIVPNFTSVSKRKRSRFELVDFTRGLRARFTRYTNTFLRVLAALDCWSRLHRLIGLHRLRTSLVSSWQQFNMDKSRLFDVTQHADFFPTSRRPTCKQIGETATWIYYSSRIVLLILSKNLEQ